MAIKKFLIVGLPRSGSTYLATLLNSHKDIECSGEIFNPYAVVGLGENDDSIEVIADRDAKPLKFFKEFFSKDTDAKALGFKFMIGHNVKVLKEIGNKPDISIIYIFRKNKLAQVSSWMVAVSSGQWAVSNKSKTPAKEAAENGFLSSLFARKKPVSKEKGPELLDVGPRPISHKWHEYATYDYLFMSWLKTLPNKRMIVDYKSLFDESFPRKVCRFLEVEYDDDMKSNLLKQSSNKVLDRFRYKKSIGDYFRRRGLGNWLGYELQDDSEDDGTQ